MKRALVVGIDHYPGMPLAGCVADAEAVGDVLETNADGSPNFSVQRLVSRPGEPDVTRASLRAAISELFNNAKDTDLLFFFAGHGAPTEWGAELVTQDAQEHSLGVSMNDLVTAANRVPARSVTLILDCCFSGHLGDVPALQGAAVADQFRLGVAVLRENVSVLAAARPTQTSQESAGHGDFTRVMLDGFDGGATDHLGRITALTLYGFVSAAFSGWDQRPMLKAHMTAPAVLRNGPPWLDPALLRELPQHFPAADARIALTPEHEGERTGPLRPGEGTPQQHQFDYFGRLRNANLVTTDDRCDHYWVAMNGGDVYLTPLGQYFWRLAQKRVL